MISPAEQPNFTEAERGGLDFGEGLQPQIEFVYGSHATEEDAQQLVERLQPYNVVALELVADPIGREKAQTFANQVTHAESNQEVETLMGSEDANFTRWKTFMDSLLRGLAQSQKEIIFIDADRNLPFMERPNELVHDLYKKMSKQPPQEILGHLKEYIEAEAQRDAKREELVADQAEMIAETLSPDDRLGVFQGAVHTPTFIRLKRAGLPVDRTIINQQDDSEHRGVKIVYKGTEQAGRQLRMTNEPLSDETWTRLLIEMYGNYTLYNKPQEYQHAFIDKLRDTTAAMDKSQLTELLGEIEQKRLKAIDSARVGGARSQPDSFVNPVVSELRFRRYLTGLLRRTVTNN